MNQPTPTNDDETGLLRTFLSMRDASCPRCGYSLRGLTSDRCPECGDALSLGLSGESRPMGAYLAAVVAVTFGLGGSGLLVMLLMVDEGLIRIANEVLALLWHWLGPKPEPSWRVFHEAKLMLLLLTEAVLTGAGLAWLLLARSAYLKYSLEVRVGLTVAMWAGVLFYAIACVLLVR